MFAHRKCVYTERRKARKICGQTPLDLQRFFLSETVPSLELFFLSFSIKFLSLTNKRL